MASTSTTVAPSSSSLPPVLIARDKATKEVNLFHVALVVKGNNGRYYTESAMKALSIPRRVERKIDGKGVTVLTGTDKEALEIAAHLKATPEQLEDIEVSLAASRASPAADGNPYLHDYIGVAEESHRNIGFEEARDMKVVRALVASKASFPIPFDETTSAWLEYSTFNHGRKALLEAMKAPEFQGHVDAREELDPCGPVN